MFIAMINDSQKQSQARLFLSGVQLQEQK